MKAFMGVGEGLRGGRLATGKRHATHQKQQQKPCQTLTCAASFPLVVFSVSVNFPRGPLGSHHRDSPVRSKSWLLDHNEPNKGNYA